MSRHVFSLFWFGLTLVVFILQLFPVPGIFLTVLLAPFWSVVTINLGVLSIVVEVVMFRTSKAWLILPFLWFGGYLAGAALTHRLTGDAESWVPMPVIGCGLDSSKPSWSCFAEFLELRPSPTSMTMGAPTRAIPDAGAAPVSTPRPPSHAPH